jgi:pyruvate/2-oxoglutarate dehydrogenase complex dihydrolipoamide dehydrogenase (E3) component
MTHFDAIIIGTGQAGPPLVRRLAAAGRRTAIIERGKFGGTCVNTGCIPTKAMVASAYAAHMARRAAEFGVSTGEISVDIGSVMARKEKMSGASRTSLEASLRELENCTVYTGHARFESPSEVVVGGERLSAPQIFINVGARAAIPEIAGLESTPYLTNSSMMNLAKLPKHLVIIGGSYIGLEFGQMFRRFGSEVTIVEKGPRFIPREDEDISRAILEIFTREGIRAEFNVESVHLADYDASHVLIATGRRPNTDDLALDKAGVAADKHGYVVVDDTLRTSVPGIWALGDCNGKGAFTHTSYNDYEIVASNLLDEGGRKVSDRITTYGLFIDPPLGRAGMTEAQARATGKKLLLGKRPMSRVARAVEKGESQGFMKILADADSKLILGAAILGPGGDEAIHSILDVMYAKQPYSLIQRAVHIHPTVSELIPTMLGEMQSF